VSLSRPTSQLWCGVTVLCIIIIRTHLKKNSFYFSCCSVDVHFPSLTTFCTLSTFAPVFNPSTNIDYSNADLFNDNVVILLKE